MRLVVAVAAAAAVGAAFAPAAMAQDTTGVGAVRGVVADGRQSPVRDVAICLEGAGQCTASDEIGRFVLDRVRVGTYRLEIIPTNQPRFHTAGTTVNDTRAGSEAGPAGGTARISSVPAPAGSRSNTMALCVRVSVQVSSGRSRYSKRSGRAGSK